MADDKIDERQAIRDSTKTLKKYGSTCNHFKRQEHYIKHLIVNGDTLQGIALKYGVTMEQIRRVNRLWASDSLFLRESLMIPVNKDSAISPVVNEFPFNADHHMIPPMSPDTSTDGSERSISDFLVKIDTSIANTKSQVKKSQGFSEFRDDDEASFLRKKKTVSRLHQQPANCEVPHPVVMTQGRKVRTSLQKLEQEQDEMFEL